MWSFLHLVEGECDDELRCQRWPVEIEVHLKLLSQAGDHAHVGRTARTMWTKDAIDSG